MSNWLSRLIFKQEGEDFKSKPSETPAILFRCNLTPEPQEYFTITIDKIKSGHICNLHELLSEYAKIFAIRYGSEKKSPQGFSHVPLEHFRYPVWKMQYFQLVKKHASYYGLKLMKNDGGKWILARCFDCDTCTRRVDCLTEEP